MGGANADSRVLQVLTPGGIQPYRETQQYVTRVLGAQARMLDEDGSPGTSRAPLGDARLAWLLLGGVGLLLLVLAAGTE